MAGYARQSVADIIANAVIKAAPVNAEYNAIRDAFAFATGHKHDGSSTEGAYVPLIADTDALNKVVVDTANNRIGIFTEVSAAAVEQVRFQDGAIVPVTDNDIDLGASGTKFKNLYVNGIASIGSITLSGGTIDDTVIGGTTPNAGTFTTLTATTVDLNGGNIDGTIIGATTPAAADFTTMDASGNATIGGTLGVTGVTTLGTANITSVDLDSGAIDNTTIGAATPAAGTFTTLAANTSLTAVTADINGGTLDGVVIGGTSSAAATVTDLTATGTSTLTTVDINGGAIDGTTIGASSAAAGSFTTVSTSGQATLATADINGGTIDNATIGATTPAAITGTTITGTSFVGPVTGNVTGNLTGDVTGDLTGDVTGNITSSGSSSFNNVTIDGTLNMNAGTTATITNLTSPTSTNDAATKGYVDTSIANLVDSAPGTLDTLNELAAALDDDPNFSTTITNSIATKLPLAGGTMTGAIAMSTNKITGLGDPTAAQDAMTKAYADATYLALSGGTMTGAIDMGSQKITTTYTPTDAADLTTKTYVDGILGSATAASASAAAAATSEANAATSETNAANSESAAAASEAAAAASYDSFDDRYLGAKASAPTLDNDGDALVIGALYFNTTTNIMNVYGSGGWQSAGSAVNGTSDRVTYTATSGQTVFSATYDSGYVDVYLNGVKLLAGTDFTATNGTSITLASGAAVNDIVDIVAYGTFVLADHYSKTQSDARYVEVAGDTMTGNLDITGTLTSDGLTVDGAVAINGTSAGQLTIDATGQYGQILFEQNSGNNSGGDIIYDHTSDQLWLRSLAVGGINLKTSSTAGSAIDRLTVSYNGDISFYEDTGTTAKFFWDASAESLGIGTSSTGSETLVVEKSSGTPSIRINAPAGSEAQLKLQADAGGASFTDTQLIHAKTDASLAFSRWTGAAYEERMRIDSSGKVFVGFDNAAYANGDLVVGKGAASGNSTLGIQSSGSANLNKINFGDGGRGDRASIISGATNYLAFSTFDGSSTTTERMRITSSGNVGIGTTSPDTLLELVDLHPTLTVRDSDGTTSTASSTLRLAESGASDTLGSYWDIAAKDSAWQLAFTHNSSGEAMRIDSSGNLLVGKTGTGIGTAGIQAEATGQLNVTKSGDAAIRAIRLASDGDILKFYKDGTTVGSISVDNSNLFIASPSGTNPFGVMFIKGSDPRFVPVNTSGGVLDNTIDLGYSNARWDDIWATNGTIQTSDQNEKQDIAELTDAEMTAAKAISKLFKTFKWNDSVAEKGDAARTHSGVIAQEVEQAMTDAGLDAGDYAFFISTTWWETQTEVPAVEADEENGVEAQEAYTRTDTYDTLEEAPEGATERNRKGIRYPQLLSFIGAATEQRLASIETRLDALEAN